MAPRPISPIEALAKRQVKPITPIKTGVVKQAAPPPVNPFLPSTTVPSTGAAANVPGNKPFVGPTLDPDVLQARTKLTQQETTALQAGVDPAIVKSIVAGEGDPNRGFLGAARTLGSGLKNIYSIDIIPGKGKFQPLVKATNLDIIPGSKEFKPVKATGKLAATVGTKALVAASPALDKLDFGRRLVTSTLKEVGDEVRVWRGNADRGKEMGGTSDYEKFQGKGGFSASDWWNQLSKEGGIDGGKFFSNIENPYANQLLGFFADVFLDPTTYVTGPGGIAKTAVSRGVITGATKKGANIAARAAVAEADNFAAALARKAAEDLLDDAIKIGDNAAAKAAEEAIIVADKQAAAAAKILAGDAAGRTLGRTSNQALAEQVLGVRDEAQKVIDLGTAPAGELAYAQRTVEVLNDAVIANIQKSGLAGIAGPFVDIIKGVRTPAQDILGVRGGLRIVNPIAAVGGPGPLRAIIPGTERITNFAGKLLSESRLGLGNTALGARVINNITPAGEGGILGSADLLEMRTGLRLGKLSPQEAAEATRLLQLDQQYRALVNNERKVAGGFLAQVGFGKGELDADTLNEVVRLRQVAAMTGSPVAFAIGSKQQIAANAIDKYFDDLYEFSVKASEGTGYIPPKRANYFPQMQSDEAIRWAQKFPKKAEELAKQLNVDRTWFVGNFRARDLQVGDKFFGKVLTKADIDGGAQALNAIARKYGLKFDYFETDALTVIGKYTQRHAQFTALQKSIGSLPETLPSMAARVQGSKFVTPTPTLPSTVKINPEFFNFFDPTTGTVGIDALVLNALKVNDPARFKSFIDDMNNLAQKANAKVVDKKEFETLLVDVETRMSKIRADIASGAIDLRTAVVATDAAQKEIMAAYSTLLSSNFDITSIPANRWTEYTDIVKKGFEVLNDSYTDPITGKFIQGTAPSIAVKEELADLLRNAERLGDPAFAARARQIVKDYTRFSKAYLVARPGFHARNAYSNVFQLIAAGANPANLLTGNKLLNRINKGLKNGFTPRQVATALVDSGTIKLDDIFGPNRRAIIDALENTINYSGNTGFGQFGEIAAEVGTQNRGLLQVGAPRNKASQAVGQLLVWNRKAGEFIENYSRFGLMWDGIAKGLSPQEAAARSNKYLVDYADLSNVDKVAKQIIPFWTFMSRNTPLQLELMWTNPRAYALYNSAKRQIEGESEEEGGLVIPGYEKDRGVFATTEEGFGKFLPGNVIRPGLPFPGGGDNVIKEIIENPKGFLSKTNSLFRAPLEAAFGRKLFNDAPIVDKGRATTSWPARLKYLQRELFSPTSPLVALLKAIPVVNQNKFLEEYFGINIDETDPSGQTFNSILSYLGAPVGKQRTESSVNELKSRWYDLEAYIKDAQDRAKIKQEERIKDAEQNPIAPGVNPFLPSTTAP